MNIPNEPKKGIPAYMVSFGDMVTLLLTFFILLVALADTQESGLVGAGRGPIVRHVLAKGRPGLLPGRLREDRQAYMRDNWWVPSQQGDPDQLELVREKLESEMRLRFQAFEASIHVEPDRIVLRLPAELGDDLNDPDRGLDRLLDILVASVRSRPERRVRINGGSPASGRLDEELRLSAVQCQLIYNALVYRGVRPDRISVWGWGATRPLLPEDPESERNRTMTVELIDPEPAAATGGVRNGRR